MCAGNTQHGKVIRSYSVLCITCTHFGACNGNSEMLNILVKHCPLTFSNDDGSGVTACEHRQY